MVKFFRRLSGKQVLYKYDKRMNMNNEYLLSKK